MYRLSVLVTAAIMAVSLSTVGCSGEPEGQEPAGECEEDADCAGDRECLDGECTLVVADCEPGEEYRCGAEGETIEVCGDDGESFVEYEPCGADTECSTADGPPECVEVDDDNDDNGDEDCETGELRCSADESAVEVCAGGDGGWEVEVDCESDYRCSEDYETPRCTPAPQDYLEFVVGQDPASHLNDWDGFEGDAEYNPEDDEHLWVWLGDDEHLEHVLFDLTEAPDADLGIRVSHDYSAPLQGASGWAIRNVGVRGVPQQRSSHYTVAVATNDPDGTGVIENVFADYREPTPDQSQANDTGYDGGWGWSFSAHVGIMEVRHSFVAGMGDNAYYFEQDRNEGTVHWEHCYHRDNQPTNFRTALRDSTITDSMAVMNDPEGTRGGYGPGDGTLGANRAYWNRGLDHDQGAPVRVDNLQIYFDPDTLIESGGELREVWDSYLGGAVWGSDHNGEYTEMDVVGGTINSAWLDYDDADSPNDGWAFEHHDEFEFNFIEDVVEADPDPSILGEGVPYTPEMAAEGTRGIPPEPLGPAPGGGVPGTATN